MSAEPPPARGISRRALRPALLLVALVALALAARALPLAELLEDLRATIERLGPRGALLFCTVYTVSVVLVLPCFLLGMLAGAVFGVWKGTALVLVAATLGATLAFWLGRGLLRGFVEARYRDDPRFQAMDAAIAARGWKVIALLRLSPLVPFGPSNYLYGLIPIRTWSYVLASAASMVPGTMVYVTLGHLGRTGLEREVPRTPLEQAWVALGVVASIAVVWWLGRLARRALTVAPAGDRD